MPEPARRHALFLRAAWGADVRLASAAVDHPTLERGNTPRLVLPTPPHCHAAATAHAGAHLAHGGPPLARGTLKPLQQALLGTLEDARVEQAALRELPGLRHLWLPWHDATPALGVTFAALLRRLQRRLIDPDYQDPHPWVDKAWRLYQATDGSPAALRPLASLLGHDLGQMRLPFDAQADVIGPPYRDDHRHLWDPDPAQAAPAGQTGTGSQAPPVPPDTGRRLLHPEWDWRIGRLRPAWCTVTEVDAVAADGASPGRLDLPPAPTLARHWRSGQPDGPAFDEARLAAAAAALRLRRPVPRALHRGPARLPQRRDVRLVLDRSLSTTAPAPAGWPGAGTVLQAQALAALSLLHGFTAAGHRVTMQAFSSNGRHAVRVAWLLRHGLPAQETGARLGGLVAEGSTRLGTAVRHAVATLPRRAGATVLLLTDGEPHDIDVHERRYLIDDLAHAVRCARQAGITAACLVVGRAPPASLRRCFEPGACVRLATWRDLPTAARLVA